MEQPEEKPAMPISDHAVLRYLERVKGVDIAAIKREISPGEKVRAAAREMGGQVRIKKHDCVLVIANDVVVTVLNK